jgi:hypothetical protein
MQCPFESGQAHQSGYRELSPILGDSLIDQAATVAG